MEAWVEGKEAEETSSQELLDEDLGKVPKVSDGHLLEVIKKSVIEFD